MERSGSVMKAVFGLLEQVQAINPFEEIDVINVSIPGAILVVRSDAEFTVEQANQGLFDLLGFSPEEFAQRFENKGVRAIHPDDAPSALSEFLLQIHQQENQSFRLKTRLVHKQFGYRWVHICGCVSGEGEEQERIYCILTDITEQQETLNLLRKEMLFHEMVENLCEDAFFDCDILSGSIRFSKNFAKRFEIEEFLPNYQSLLECSIVADDSTGFFESKLYLDAEETAEEELHLLLPTGEEVWYSCHYKSFFDRIGIPVRTVGKLTEITKQKSRIEELSEQAARDPLTGLFNKTTTELLINTNLNLENLGGEKNALLIVDVDNFKDINDRLGHFYGDLVLKQLAEGLKELFSPDDVVGRIGGDEFFIFLRDYGSTKDLRKKAEEIQTLFRKIFHENMETVHISASIGIALCPEHGEDFYTLYQNADSALYVSKQWGKDGYTIFGDQVPIPYQASRSKMDLEAPSMERNQGYSLDSIYRRIYSAKHINRDFREVLRLLAERYQFQRAYLYEWKQGALRNTFEWCAEGFPSALDRSKEVPRALVTNILKNLESSGLYYLHSPNDLPPQEREQVSSYGIQSMVQFAIKRGRDLVGFIGFDAMHEERAVSERELEELGAICFVIGSFINNHRLYQEEKRVCQNLESLLDALPNEVYVVEAESFRILFENQVTRTRTLVPASEGKVCYEAYWKRKDPCKHCPMRDLKRETASKGGASKPDLSRNSFAKWIPWGENTMACLITHL